MGELARKRAEHVYARAARLAHELSEDDSAAIQRSVVHLRTRIEWLSQGAIAAPASSRPADSLDIVDVDQLLESH